jgi:hypothetical protein
MWHFNKDYRPSPSKNPYVWIKNLIDIAESRCIEIAKMNKVSEEDAKKCKFGNRGCDGCGHAADSEISP